MPLAVGHRIGEFEIKEVLGSGGMATVYCAFWTTRSSEVALKVLHAHIAEDPTSVERFLRETRAAEKLSNPHPHPHIAQVYASGNVGKDYYIAMELLRGGSLRDRLQNSRRLPVAEAVKIAQTVAKALDHAHQRGIIHRDVSPQNIMFDSAGAGGQVKLTDFGIAKVMDEASITMGPIGKGPYMSPEQCRGDTSIDGRSDLYALGIVLYEMVEGRPPFTGTFQKVMQDHQRTPPPKISNPTVSAELQAVISKALAKDPRKRHQSGAEEMAAQLEAIPVDAPIWVERVVCARSGVLPNPNCRKKSKVRFAQGQEPKTKCQHCQLRASLWQRLWRSLRLQRPTSPPVRTPEPVTPIGANGRSAVIRGVQSPSQRWLVIVLATCAVSAIAAGVYIIFSTMGNSTGGGKSLNGAPIPHPPPPSATWNEVTKALQSKDYAKAKALAEKLNQHPELQLQATQVIAAIEAHEEVQKNKIDDKSGDWQGAWKKTWGKIIGTDNITDAAVKKQIDDLQRGDRDNLAHIGYDRVNSELSKHPIWLDQDRYEALKFIDKSLKSEPAKAKLEEFNPKTTQVCSASGLLPNSQCPKPKEGWAERHYLKEKEPQKQCVDHPQPPLPSSGKGKGSSSGGGGGKRPSGGRGGRDEGNKGHTSSGSSGPVIAAPK